MLTVNRQSIFTLWKDVAGSEYGVQYDAIQLHQKLTLMQQSIITQVCWWYANWIFEIRMWLNYLDIWIQFAMYIHNWCHLTLTLIRQSTITRPERIWLIFWNIRLGCITWKSEFDRYQMTLSILDVMWTFHIDTYLTIYNRTMKNKMLHPKKPGFKKFSHDKLKQKSIVLCIPSVHKSDKIDSKWHAVNQNQQYLRFPSGPPPQY